MKNDARYPDLSDVDPLKWAEVRRRVEVLDRYSALPNPSAADRGRFGAMLDLGSQQFVNLSKAWAADRDPRALSPGVRKRDIHESRSRSGGVDPVAREIARDVIGISGTTTSLSVLSDTITERCLARGVAPPSRGTVWLLMVEAKGRGTGISGDSIIIAQAFLKLPVDTGAIGGLVFPKITVAVDSSTRRILALELSYPALPPELGRMAAVLRNATSSIIADETVRTALSQHLPAGNWISAVSATSARHSLADLMGRRIGRIEIAYKPLAADPTSVMQSRRDRAPDRSEAEQAIRFAVARHNRDVEAGEVRPVKADCRAVREA
ncbi:hypothetical protein E5673_14250 [Sphingomonas sp. PAMC26645]|uniref:hypothetical protein n=1 Tax=Sphingomonas sp. PAMC26645 TaxID=2565555 RepID=UPI00109DBB92|nr:hypothetical protein [Sphingomonas sp. PAMC26645]QCB43242.1 hypothetical protein E5673_14250 [Sphingomonas sp. PAMC26645]